MGFKYVRVSSLYMANANVFLAPVEPGGFDRTVRSAVELSEYPDRPGALAGTDEARFWGVADESNNRTYFEKMEPGDLVLFYGEEGYVGTGWIGTTFEDGDGWASATFWDDEPLSLVYTIEDFTPVSVPKAAVNAIFDYGGGYSPGGLMRVADERVTDQPETIKRAVEMYDRRKG